MVQCNTSFNISRIYKVFDCYIVNMKAVMNNTNSFNSGQTYVKYVYKRIGALDILCAVYKYTYIIIMYP
jgi:hypothetical protein